MIEGFCSSLQLTMNHSKQHLNTFPLTSKVSNTQMCGLFPSPLPSGFCVAMCLCYRCKQQSLQSEWAEGSSALGEHILQILEIVSLAKANITLLLRSYSFRRSSLLSFCFIPGLYTVTCLTSQLNGPGSCTGTMNVFMRQELGCTESLTKVTAEPVKCCS